MRRVIEPKNRIERLVFYCLPEVLCYQTRRLFTLQIYINAMAMWQLAKPKPAERNEAGTDTSLNLILSRWI